MRWYYAHNGEQIGPVEKEELQEKLESGEVAMSDLVWRDGMGVLWPGVLGITSAKFFADYGIGVLPEAC